MNRGDPSSQQASPPLSTGFMVIHGNQPELLRQLLVHWFQAHPLMPLEDETILVQSNGIAQWLKLALAGEDAQGGGIAAAFDLLLPSRFVWRAYRAVLGESAVPEQSPFDKSLLIWRLLRLLPGLLAQPGYAPLQRFLADDADLRKRHQLAEKIADLFDQYQVFRADWLAAWRQGEDVLITGRGERRPLAEAHRWQPLLWRALLVDVARTTAVSPAQAAAQSVQSDILHSGRAAVHQRFLQTISQLPMRPEGLPRRISVFGLSSLPRQSLEVLLALSRFSQVLLCVHNPCEYFWSDILSEQDHARRQARSSASRHARKAGMPEQLAAEQLHLHTHPLLAAWGRQGRDYLALLDTLDQPDSYRQQFERLGERIDIFESHGETRLLNQLQDDIRQLRSLDESRAQWPAVDPASDHSLRFHTAHSTQREVEILQDQLLATFAADPSLRPRDVIVMVPDVNAFAPHIDAVFGQLDASDPRYLPYSIADQESRQQAPLAFALEFLLNLPEARLAVSELFDLLDVAALRQRFGLAAADLPRLRQWIRQSNIRWGLNAAHRQQFMPQATLAAQQQNTWQQGLKRMLLGYALGHDEALLAANHWQSIEAYDEVSGLGAAAVGPLASLLHALESLAQSLAKPAPPAQWGQRLRKLLDDFFLVDTASDQWLLLKFQDSLSDWLAACDAAELTEDLPLNVVRDHWLGQLDSASLTRPFMAGRLTFATLMPMRAIPYRMVCLLGMNDGQFPRSRPPLDFDLMAQDVRPGDRSRREDDRYLFLEALLSAREKLHISWVGRSNLDNSERAPSVLVSQLRDHLQAGWQLAASAASAASTSTATPASPTANLLDALTVKHPLQPFSNAYFVASADSALFTYAAEWERRPAPAAEPESKAECASLHLPLPRLDTPIELDQLAAFLKDPVRHFYHQRLDIRYDAHELAAQEQEDHEPFALDVLQQWSLQDQLIQARLAALYQGADAATEQAVIDHELARMRRAGELPVGSAGDLVTEALCEPLARMFALRAEALVAWPVRLDDQDFSYSYDVAGQSLNITGRLTNLHGQSAQGAAGARCRIEFNSSNLLEGRRYRRDKLLAPWLRHLAMHLLPEAAASGPISSLIIGKNGQVLLQPLPIEQARADFNTLLTHYVQGLCAPLPLAARTGFAWLEKQGQPCQGELADCGQLAAAIEAARNRYHGSSNQSNYGSQGELQYNAYLQQAYPDFARLWSQGRFSQLCADLYGPLLTCVGRSDETAEDKA